MLRYIAVLGLVVVSCAPEDKSSVVEPLHDTAPILVVPPPAPPPPSKSATPEPSATPLVWHRANLTHYEAFPEPGSEEYVYYNGQDHMGAFSALEERMSESWVKENNIAAVHSKDFEQYKLKTLRLRQDSHQIDVTVYDMCADSDCSGCCTANSESTGFLIDLEKHTVARFGPTEGIVEWTCLDCR